MWKNDWVGLRYREMGRGPEAFDCLGLFIALHRARFNRLVPDPQCRMVEAARNQIAEQMRPCVTQVNFCDVFEGDALMFRVGRQLLHVGYAVNAREMLHIEADAIGSVLENWNQPRWIARIEGAYRFE